MYYLQVGMICTSTILPWLAIAVVAARFKARRMKKVSLGADDWTVLLALILLVTLCITSLWGVKHAGVGQITTTFSKATLIRYFKWIYVDVILCHLVLAITKISLILLYKRIFETPKFQIAANIVLGLDVCWLIAALLTGIFVADPISDFWNKNGLTRYNFGVWTEAMAAIDMTLDVVTLCLPVPIINSLHLSTRRKISLLAIFWLGFFCIAASGVRCWFATLSKQITNSSKLSKQDPARVTFILNGNALWTRIEATASIVAVCLPTVAPLTKNLKSIENMYTHISSMFSFGSTRSHNFGDNSPPRSNKSFGMTRFPRTRNQPSKKNSLWPHISVSNEEIRSSAANINVDDDLDHVMDTPANKIKVENTISVV